MKRHIFTLLGCAIFFTCTALAGEKVHWGYTGHEGPEHWGKLHPEFALCASGKNQSPINLENFVEADLAPIQFNYATDATEIVNNGHTIVANYEKGSTITIRKNTFELKQFHFHSPSENHINGKSFPMEGHLVHADKMENLAVVAVMYEIGQPNKAIEKLWNQMPDKAGHKYLLKNKVNGLDVLPEDKAYYRFNGSLTTPPCSEGVWWFVMKEPVTVSKAQIDKFAHIMHHPNNRPVQPVNARTILE